MNGCDDAMSWPALVFWYHWMGKPFFDGFYVGAHFVGSKGC